MGCFTQLKDEFFAKTEDQTRTEKRLGSYEFRLKRRVIAIAIGVRLMILLGLWINYHG